MLYILRVISKNEHRSRAKSAQGSVIRNFIRAYALLAPVLYVFSSGSIDALEDAWEERRIG